MKRTNIQHMMRACICAGVLTLGTSISQVLAQGVGINTTTPDPSAALDIKAGNKGILIPQVQLQSLIDQFTIPAPAHGLLVYHMGSNLGGKGFFYNSGLSNGPVWKRVGELTYPYYHGGAEDVLFNLENYKQNSTTIRTYSVSGPALDVEGGLKIAGPGQSPGLGKVLTSDPQGNAKWEGAVAFRASGVFGGKMGSSVAKIPFSIEDYDISNNYSDINDPLGNTFVAPSKGVYHFDLNIRWSTNDDYEENDRAFIYLWLVRGGSQEELGRAVELLSLNRASFSTDVFLETGDEVSIKLEHENTGKYIQLTSSLCSFTGRLVVRQ